MSGTTTTTDRDSHRIAPLDGLRGIAIILVIIHQAGTGDVGADTFIVRKLWSVLANAGWVGVQLFFALSGFLITRILLDNKGAPGALRSFYVRRVLRIVPIYYVLLAIVFFIAPHVPALSPIADAGTRNQLWYWAYLSNYFPAFGGIATALPHIWSLCVEEQFYLVWPWLVRVTSERALAWTCIALVIAAIVARRVLHGIYDADIADSAAYTFTFTRWDAIALGGLIAIWLRRPGTAARLKAAIPGALTTVFMAIVVIVVIERSLAAQGTVADFLNMPLTGMASALIVAACVTAGPAQRGMSGNIRRLAGARWLVTVGKYSYAMYVFHIPVHLLLRPHFANALDNGSAASRTFSLMGYTGGVFVVSFLLALVSWMVIERPALSFKRNFPMPVG